MSESRCICTPRRDYAHEDWCPLSTSAVPAVPMTPPSVPPRPYESLDALPVRSLDGLTAGFLVLDGRVYAPGGDDEKHLVDRLLATARLALAARSLETPAPCVAGTEWRIRIDRPNGGYQEATASTFEEAFSLFEESRRQAPVPAAPPAPTSGVTAERHTGFWETDAGLKLDRALCGMQTDRTKQVRLWEPELRDRINAAVAALAAPAPRPDDMKKLVEEYLADEKVWPLGASSQVKPAVRGFAVWLASRAPTTEKPRE